MSSILQTLIIPTRNRQDTAVFAIESALNAHYDNLQIVVCDNSDDDRLRDELKRLNWLSRIVYHKNDQVLSMRDNWEVGIDLSEGALVSVIGDDDAVLPDAFQISKFAFSKLDIDVLHSVSAIYKWPSYPFVGRRGYLGFTMSEEIKLMKEPRSVLRRAVDYDIKLGTGPGLYYGFVRRTFLEKIKALRGRWIVDPIPDFDSGFATLMYSDAYAVSERPLFVQGHSGKSNSGAMRFAAAHDKNITVLSRESGGDAIQIFPKEFGRLRGNNAVIVAAQMRILPEIRNALNDPSAAINLRGAWDYMLEGAKGGYDNIEFLASIGSLEALADLWAIPDDQRAPFSLKTFKNGLVHEQGFSKKKSSAKHDTSDPEDTDDGYRNITVNGNVAKLDNILDAVNFVHSVFPNIANAPDPDLAESYLEFFRKNHQKLLLKAQSKSDAGDASGAQALLETILKRDPSDEGAMDLLGDIFRVKEDWMSLSNLFAQKFTEKPQKKNLYDLLESLDRVGNMSLASALVYGLLRNNPSLKKDVNITRYLEADSRTNQSTAS